MKSQSCDHCVRRGPWHYVVAITKRRTPILIADCMYEGAWMWQERQERPFVIPGAGSLCGAFIAAEKAPADSPIGAPTSHPEGKAA